MLLALTKLFRYSTITLGMLKAYNYDKRMMMSLMDGQTMFPKITLSAARKNVGLTQIEAAKRLGIATSTLRSWEQGITYPGQPYIEKLCTLYNLKYDYINFLPN